MDRAPIAFLTENMKVWNQDILDPADDFCGWPSCIISLLLLRLGLSQSKKNLTQSKKKLTTGIFSADLNPINWSVLIIPLIKSCIKVLCTAAGEEKVKHQRKLFCKKKIFSCPPSPSPPPPAPSFLGANWKFPANCAAPILTRRSNWIFRFHFFRAAIKCTFFSNHIYFVSYLLKGRGSEGVRGAW